MNEEFRIKEYYPYLKKDKVMFPTELEIVNVLPNEKNKNRPVFIGKFKFGTYKFDLCIEEMQNFTSRYGNIPKKWLGLKIWIIARKIKIKNREGLRIYFINNEQENPLEGN